jgi:hypothetical protein
MVDTESPPAPSATTKARDRLSCARLPRFKGLGNARYAQRRSIWDSEAWVLIGPNTSRILCVNVSGV